MGKKSVTSKGLRTGKAFIISFISFILLIGIIGFLIRFTPLPERWMLLYVMGALYLASFLIGLLTGNVVNKRGVLFGALSSIVFLLLIVVAAVLITGTFSETGILRIHYLPCVVIGGIGGMVGVNMKE